MKQRKSTVLGFLAAGLLAASGCGRDTPDRDRVVTALVAASTKEAVQEVAALFRKEGGAEVALQADDSARLATQIVEGSPADLYLSANERWADFIKDKGFARESTLLLSNRLVLVVPKGNPGHVAQPAELAQPAIRHIALAGPTVPAGIYARQALKALGLWDAVESRIVSGQNVRVTLAYVERGEVEAGIVYATDARVTDRALVVHEFAAATHDSIRYPLVLLKAAQEHAAARRFYTFLQSAQATAVFQKHGFTSIASTSTTAGPSAR